MTRGLSFSEAFWDSDITGTLGWDRLCKRMKDGKNVCQAVLQYVKERAKAEADYSKALSNISRKVDGKEETGDLGVGWNLLKTQTEQIASIHEEASRNFNSLAEELSKFSEEQKRSKAQLEDTVKRYIQSKKTEYNKTMNAKKSYESKCVELRDAETNYETTRGSVTSKKNELEKDVQTKYCLGNGTRGSVTSKKNELEKAEKNKVKASEHQRNADVTYKSALNTLESVRQNWEDQTVKACEAMEQLEVKRLECLRDLIWRSTNIDSITCVGHDDCCEKVRDTLERCDVMVDIQGFIENNKTGSKRPDPVEYESYYKPADTPTKPSRPQNMSLSMRPPQPPPSKTMPNRNIDDGAYAAISMPGNSCKVLLRVVKSHVPTNPSELKVTEGDILELVKPQNKHMMITAKYPDGNKHGVLPAFCVTQI